MDSVLAAETRAASRGIAVGVGMVAVGFVINGVAGGLIKLTAFALVLMGVVHFSSNFGRLLKIKQLNDSEQGHRGGFHHTQFSRRALSRQVMALLVAVAEADGSAGREERALVQRFLLERFFDWELVADLRRWRVPRLPAGGLEELARSLAGLMGPADRNALFHWCCLVTFIDRSFSTEEHDALQRVSRGLGIDPHSARRLFLEAKARAMATFQQQGREESGWGNRGWGGGWHDGQQGAGGQRNAPPPGGPSRAQALQTLGLGQGASAEEIRRRHRELVKQHHPDRTSHLGEIARRQATERFTEIQTAYEVLTKGTS